MDLPKDIFPGREELMEAVGLDELCNEINTMHDHKIELLGKATDARLDRIGFEPGRVKVKDISCRYTK